MKYVDKETIEICRKILQQKKMMEYTSVENESKGIYDWESSSNWEKFPEDNTNRGIRFSSAHAPGLKGIDSYLLKRTHNK